MIKILKARHAGNIMQVSYNMETGAIVKREVFDYDGDKLDLRSVNRADKEKLVDKIDIQISAIKDKKAAAKRSSVKSSAKTVSTSKKVEKPIAKPVAAKPAKSITGKRERLEAAAKVEAKKVSEKPVAKSVVSKSKTVAAKSVDAKAEVALAGEMKIVQNVAKKYKLAVSAAATSGAVLTGDKVAALNAYYVIRENYGVKMPLRLATAK